MSAFFLFFWSEPEHFVVGFEQPWVSGKQQGFSTSRNLGLAAADTAKRASGHLCGLGMTRQIIAGTVDGTTGS